MWYNGDRDRNSSSFKGGRKLDGDRLMASSEELWREVLEAAETVLRDSEILMGRGAEVWREPRMQRLAQRAALMRRKATEEAPLGEQLMLAGFKRREAEPEPMLKRLQKAVRKGTAKVEFPVGTVIADAWTDTVTKVIYEAPLRIVAYGRVRLASGKECTGAILLRERALPFRVQYDAADDKHPYGSNFLVTSDLLVWLNSEALRANWWYAQHDRDVEPEYAREKGGYLAGCSPELRGVMAEIVLMGEDFRLRDAVAGDFVAHDSLLGDSLLRGSPSGDSLLRGEEVACRVFLPSPEELGIDVTGRNILNPSRVWEYFRDTVQHPDTYCSKRRFMNDQGEPQRCWTRTPKEGRDHNYLWMVTPDGEADYSNASAKHAVVPACVVA